MQHCTEFHASAQSEERAFGLEELRLASSLLDTLAETDLDRVDKSYLADDHILLKRLITNARDSLS